MNQDVFEFVKAAAAKVSRGDRGLFDDMQQEGVLAMLELGGVLTAENKKLVYKRMADVRIALQNPHEKLSLDAFDGEANVLPVSDRLRVPVGKGGMRGPRTSPKTKHDRYRQRNMLLGKCLRCGDELPSREFATCETCRAKLSFLQRRRNRQVSHRRRSKYDSILASLGADLSQIHLTPARATG